MIVLASLIESLLYFGVLRLRLKLISQRPLEPQDRAVWLHQCCLRISTRLGIQLLANAALPTRGLLVSNHLSHLDILLFGALGPLVFVAKSDVRGWPLLGRLAACGGTVFVDRERSSQTSRAAEEMERLFRLEIPVLLFPEGTTGDGSEVLAFRSSLFEAGIRAKTTIIPAAITYSAANTAEESLCYHGDKSFLPHLYETLTHQELSVAISFAELLECVENRKQAALKAHAIVSGLRQATAKSRSVSEGMRFTAFDRALQVNELT